MKSIYDIPTPGVVVELDKVEKNIKKCVEEALKYGIAHRPHIKTHRCSELAKLQIDLGCKGITVAKLGEAEVMAEAGIKDILVAFPIIGKDKLERLLTLAKKVKVTTIINSVIGAEALSEYFENAGMSVDVLIEVDGGLNRGGLKPGKMTLEYAESVKHLKGINIIGLLYYGGLIYDSHDISDVCASTQKEHDNLVNTAAMLKKAGFTMNVLSAGSSFSGKVPKYLEGITEIRSGHYIFNDCGQLDIKLAEPDECALKVVLTIVAKPDNNTVIADGGTKTFTSDTCHYRSGFGYIVEYPDAEIYKLNEEHAFIKTSGNNPMQIGEKISVIPNHACVVTNLAEKVYLFNNGVYLKDLEIDARAKSV